MKKLYPLAIVLVLFTFASLVFGREAKLVRYPSYSNGRIAFTYLGDIWTADENGQNIQLKYRQDSKMIQKLIPGMASPGLQASNKFDGYEGALLTEFMPCVFLPNRLGLVYANS